MALSIRDLKLLWALSGGRCSHPECRESLILHLPKSGHVVLGEMAHVIGKSCRGPRSRGRSGKDSYKNTLILCPTHHSLVDGGPADYPIETLRRWKADRESQQSAAVFAQVSSVRTDASDGRVWTYFNFHRILELCRGLRPSGETDRRIALLQSGGVLDRRGFPVEVERRGNSIPNLFSNWPPSTQFQICDVYSRLLDEIVRQHVPLDLDAIWNGRALKAMVGPGTLAFLNRACYFKCESPDTVRHVRCFAKGVEVQFQFDTWGVFSSSALHYHFRGHRQVAALLVARSITSSPSGSRRLLVNATPLALGTFFPRDRDPTPRIGYERRFGQEASASEPT